MPRRTKELMTRFYSNAFADLSDAVFIDCGKLTGEESRGFRNTLRESGAAISFVKNSLAAKVLEGQGFDVDGCFIGPTAIVYGASDVITASKAISDWSKKNGNKISFKADLLEGEALDHSAAEQLAKMPTVDELKQMLVSAVAGPLTGLVGVTNSILTGIPGVLQAIADKKQEEGE